jgi:UDP-N-acetyl-D-mannosaminuronate dehydrogenase
MTYKPAPNPLRVGDKFVLLHTPPRTGETTPPQCGVQYIVLDAHDERASIQFESVADPGVSRRQWWGNREDIYYTIAPTQTITPQIGIVGYGFVGQAVSAAFSTKCKVLVYDTKFANTKLADLKSCSVIFICVPTNATNSMGVAEYDTTALDRSLEQLAELNYSGVVIIKSTTPIDWWDEKSSTPKLSVVYCPEFLTERRATSDFLARSHHIVGTTDPHNAVFVKTLYNDYGSFDRCVTVTQLTPKEAALAKIITNTALAIKVALANQMFDVFLDYVHPAGDTLNVGAEWDKFIAVVTANDPRLGTTHWSVPGHTGYGYGGKCLPSSINHFSSLVVASGTPNFHNIALAASEYNESLHYLNGVGGD